MRFKLSFIFVLLGFCLCGCGSGSSDTMGTLSIGSPTITSTGTIATGGVHVANFSVTYAPPPGKSPNGVITHVEIRNSAGAVVANWDTTLTSSNVFNYSFQVNQTASVQSFSIIASVNSMTSGAALNFPAGT